MKRTVFICFVLIICAGCAHQQLMLTGAQVSPPEISPGAEILVSVHVIDTKGVVKEVIATVREERSIRLELNDLGENGDKAAGDGVWSAGFRVPYDARSRTYHCNFSAYDVNGDRVKIKTKENGEAYLKTEVPVKVVR